MRKLIVCIAVVMLGSSIVWANKPETGGTRLKLALEDSPFPIRVQPLPPGKEVRFACPEGRDERRIMVKLKSSRKAGVEGDVMAGGYDLFLPEFRYLFYLNGKPITPRFTARTPNTVGRDSAGNGVCTAWVVFDETIPAGQSASFSIKALEPDCFLTQIALLDPRQWKAEQLRASGKYTEGFGSGIGYYGHWIADRPHREYPAETVREFILSLENLKKEKNIDLTAHAQALGTFLQEVEAFYGNRYVQRDSTVAQGVELAEKWESFYRESYRLLKRDFSPELTRLNAELKKIQTETNFACNAGREARFYAGLAQRYFDYLDIALKNGGNSGDGVYSFQELNNLVSCFYHGSNFAAKAKSFAAQPQTTVTYDDFFVKPDSTVVGVPVKQPEQIVLNGAWDVTYCGHDDKLPAGPWQKVNIPQGPPINYWNPNKVSWKTFGEMSAAFWDAALIDRMWFKTSFEVPARWAGNRIELAFADVVMYAEVFVNGKIVGVHCGQQIPFSFDVSKVIVPGKTNHLLVRVHSSKKVALGKYGVSHGLDYGYLYPVAEQHAYSLAINSDVVLKALPELQILDTYVRTPLSDKKIIVSQELRNDSAAAREVVVRRTVLDRGTPAASFADEVVTLSPGESRRVTVELPLWENARFWGIGGAYGDPHNRYTLKTELVGESAVLTDFALRELRIKGKQIYLNGIEMPLQGDSPAADPERIPSKCNKWNFLFFNQVQREANVTISRIHRCPSPESLIEAFDDAGVISEPEADWWGDTMWAPESINKKGNTFDPVWSANVREYYYHRVKAIRNHPSSLLFSLGNECFNSQTRHVLMEARKIAELTAPHIIFTDHSNSSVFEPESPIAYVHDYGVGVPAIAYTAKVLKKPFIVGEFWNPQITDGLLKPQTAKGALRVNGLWLEKTIGDYYRAGVSGVMPFTFSSFGTIKSAVSADKFTPWGDLYLENPRSVWAVPISWPALSGRGGIKTDWKSLSNMGLAAGAINYFDSSRMAVTRNDGLKAYQKAFRPIPQIQVKRAPELLVKVRRGGEALPGANIFIASAFMTPECVPTDNSGTSWFVLRQPGEYSVSFETGGKTFRKDVVLKTTPVGRAGWDYLPVLELELETGNWEFTPGVNLPEWEVNPIQHAPAVSAIRPDHKIYAGLAPVGPAGYICKWLLLSPFPNSVTPAAGDGILDKALVPEESALTPYPGDPTRYRASFPKDEKAYRDAFELENQWDWFCSREDKVDLLPVATADRPGLDSIPIHIVSYVACYLESPEDRQATLSIGSDDGYKIWLNGKLVARNRVYRACKPDENQYPVSLKKGWNRLVMKIEQAIGGYEFAIRFLDQEGKAMVLNHSLKLPANTEQQDAVAFDRTPQKWQVLGPFMNPGERPNCEGFSKDYLGSETASEQDFRKHYTASFRKYAKAFWDDQDFKLSWKPWEADREQWINLGEAFVQPTVPGLDLAPVQYCAGYAAAKIELSEECALTLRVTTSSGVKVWIDGREVIADHFHSRNLDPNSPIFAKSKDKLLSCPVTLSKGSHTILVKLDTDYGDMKFKLQLEHTPREKNAAE